MASRFPPSSGFNSRDRSPQRFGDRRPPGPRGLDDGNSSFGREPPRGPRALVDSPRGGPYGGGRGRGYGRGDFRDRDRDLRDRDRDRDFRDNRDGPPFRRDMDRDWNRRDRDFDPRDNRGGFGRGRSRSPTRDFRDIREPPGRDFDLVRMRRNSRDSLLSASSGGPDGPPPSISHRGGGSMRGRGRGDWEGGRGRGRPLLHDDRELFRRRSRSRDTWRDRGRDRISDRIPDRLPDRIPDRLPDRLPERLPERLPDRERDRDGDRDRPPVVVDRPMDRDRDREIRDRDREREIDRRERFDRRGDWDTRRPDRDDRDRPLEPWKRTDRPPSRTDNHGSVGPTSSLPQSIPPGPPAAGPDRPSDQSPLDQNRKGSILSGPPAPDTRRDSERSETISRPEPPKEPTSVPQHSPPPSAPQVPAFGFVSAPIPAVPTPKGPPEGRTGSDASIQAEKDRTDAPPVQPPTGPKADRRGSAHQIDSARPHEEPIRNARASTHVSDRSPPTAPAAMAKRDSISGPTDPIGPGKSSSITSSPTLSRLPQPAPLTSSKEPSTSPRMSTSNIPTAPRAYHQRQAPSPRGLNKGNKPWVRRSFSRGPSVPLAPPKKESEERETVHPAEDEKPHQEERIASPEPVSQKGSDKAVTEPVKLTSPISPSMRLPIRSSPPPVPTVEEGPVSEPEKLEKGNTAPIPDFQSTDEEEENAVFDQEYLEERKRIFEKDMQALRAELPPSPLEDPTIISLLLRIQLLGKIAQEEIPEQLSEPLPSVEDEEPTAKSPVQVNERAVSFAPMKEPEPVPQTFVPSVVSRDEVTIDSLPFLNSGPPTPISDLEVTHENVAHQELFKETFRKELSRQQKQIAKKNAALREEYMSYYKPWRLDIWQMDRKKNKKPMTPGPASPPALSLPTTPAPIPEGREGRRYKGNSELDFLNALKASEISAQEELERRRTKMATARPDLSREAIIPDMLEPREKKARIYKDVNNTIDVDHAMDVFGFLPPPNDFTKEEHVIFTDAFMAHPKRWGKIAESLPGRDYRQCIVHYYLTKEEIKYKAKLNKRWSRRGRGKAKSTRPKSNALIADLGVVKPDLDGEDETPQITETGRPRRAAAPTFGDSNDTESTAPPRRGQTGKDGEPVERTTTSRRGGRGGARTQRRTKTGQQDPKAQGAPPGNPPLVALSNPESGIDTPTEIAPPIGREAIEKDSMPLNSRARPGRGRAKEGMYVFESTETEPVMAPKQAETGYGSLQPTSYWSVPEQRDFPRLLAHFGRDFEGISNFMKTKTTVMVKNYYQRRLDSGQKDFEEILVTAEDKKARGEATGPLPVPSVAPKRRYEATPSAIVPRPLAPHGELIAETDETRFPKGKPLAMSPQPVSLHGRLPENERSSSRYPTLAQASAATAVPPVAAPLGDDASRALRAQTGPSSRMSGPRMGFFSEDRRDSTLLPNSSARAHDISHHGSGAPLPTDLARMDSMAQPGYMSTQTSSLLPSTHSRQPSLTQPPGSPTQLTRPELEIASTHRDPFGQRQFYPLPGQSMGMPHSPRPVLSPVKDISRASVTPAPEAPRQVPAKRSNIMSILNDEPEDPQPRKRFASEAPSAPVPSSVPASRTVYPQSGSSRPEEVTKPAGYGQHGQYPTPSRSYGEYPSYGIASGGPATPANNDWMARFDPRAQQAGPPAQSQPPPQPSGRSAAASTPQGSYAHFGSTSSQPASSLNSLPVHSPAPTPPPATSQRPSYPNVFGQQAAGQPTTASSSRDIPPQPSSYRTASPPPRASSVAFGSRQEVVTPAQSSPGVFGIPRQTGSQSYGIVGPSTPSAPQTHAQSYQQHVQTLVNGSHRSTPVSMSGGPPQYGHNTPPPQTSAGRSMPSLTTLGRSYTPPSSLHPSVGGSGSGMGYAPPPSSSSAGIPPLQRPPGSGSLGEAATTPTHHRVYSQGSTPGGLPGSLHPPSQPPR